MNIRDAIHGFYGVIDRQDLELARALTEEASVLQIRIKSASAGELLRIARAARRMTHERGSALIINDRIDIALMVEADGVHLGQDDLSVAETRYIAPKLWIGVSTHDLAQVQAACEAGADYVSFGPVFSTRTKADALPPRGLHELRAAVVAAAGRPVVAVGGITAARVDEVYSTGARAICAIGAVNHRGDTRNLARQFRRFTL